MGFIARQKYRVGVLHLQIRKYRPVHLVENIASPESSIYDNVHLSLSRKTASKLFTCFFIVR
jgi:hypothetical protein